MPGATAYTCFSGVPATKPFVGKRRELCDSVIKGCVRVVLFALGYYWIRYKGVPSSREDAPMVVCNHSTFLDPLVLGLIFAPASVGAAEHLNIPVLGTLSCCNSHVM